MKSICQTCEEEFDTGLMMYKIYKCINCWEVETRINEYLKSENGRKYIAEKLLGYLKQH